MFAFLKSKPTAEKILALQIFNELPDSSLLTEDQMRAKVLEVAPTLAKNVLYALTHKLLKERIKLNESQENDEGSDADESDEDEEHNKDTKVKEKGLKLLFSEPSLARSFLAYHFVNDPATAVAHIDGVIKSCLTTFQWLGLKTGGVKVPKNTSLPEVAYFIFEKRKEIYEASELNAKTLTPNRIENDDVQIQYLNQIDGFIVKYFIAHIVEMYIQQKDRQVYDKDSNELLGYRAGFKVEVALDVRKAIVENDFNNISHLFAESLKRNHLSSDEFLDGKTRLFIKPDLVSVLTGEAPRPPSGRWTPW